MKLETATGADESALKDYLKRSIAPGPVDFSIERPRSFFDQYRLQSQDWLTWLVRDSRSAIKGTATAVFRSARVAEDFENIGYCTDFRITPTRQSLAAWNSTFLPTLVQEGQKRGARYHFVSMPDSLSKLLMTFLLPRTSGLRASAPKYFLVGRFQLIGVLGRMPWAQRPLSHLRIEPAEMKDLEELADYLKRKSENRLLAFPYSAEFLEERFTTWPGLHPRDILLARDFRGRIVGSVGIWNGNPVQEYRVRAYHGFSRTLKTALRFSSLLRLSHELPEVGDLLDFYFLTLLNADNPDIFDSLLARAFEVTFPRRFLVYTHFVDDFATRPPRNFLCANIPFALYTLTPGGQAAPEFLRKMRSKGPDLEAALL